MSASDFAAREAISRISVQHELAMSIGVALDIQQVLEPFLHAALRLLDLQSIHFFHRHHSQPLAQTGETATHGTAEVAEATPVRPLTINIPANSLMAACEELAHEVFEHENESLERRHGEAHYLAIRLPGVGSLVLASSMPSSTTLLTPRNHQHLWPVFRRLALSCQTCIEHQRTVNKVKALHSTQTTAGRESSHDALTDLPNRAALELRLRQTVAAAIRHGHFGALFYIDVDRFKIVNDSLGHATGDALLIALARRMQSTARDEDTLARVGGDAFILLASNLGSDAEQAARAAQALAVRLAADCRRPIDVHRASIHISTSIGICVYPEPQSSSIDDPASNPKLCSESLDSYCDDIIRFADTARYRSKHYQRDGIEFFAPQMQATTERHLAIEQQLSLALQRNELSVHFQPFVTPFGAVIGAEALLRWHNPKLGDVEPEEFIAVAEESGLIIEIGEWVIDHVCELVRSIRASDRYPQFSYISVNVSPRQIKQADFVDKVRSKVSHTRTPCSGLRLEITEHAAIDDIEDTITKMKELNALGVLMSLDDFGTGYSSLSYLHRLPISTLKLDRTFVTSIANNEENQAIVDATIAMAGHLGIECVPEGVELEGDVAYFRNRPVHTMQGFYFSAALPRKDFLHVLEHGNLGPMTDLVHQLPIDWPKSDPEQHP